MSSASEGREAASEDCSITSVVKLYLQLYIHGMMVTGYLFFSRLHELVLQCGLACLGRVVRGATHRRNLLPTGLGLFQLGTRQSFGFPHGSRPLIFEHRTAGYRTVLALFKTPRRLLEAVHVGFMASRTHKYSTSTVG